MSTDDHKPQTREEISRQQDAAANLVRTKLDALYQNEPDVEDEIETVTTLQQAPTTTAISKHQQYMQDLSTSGRSLAEIQTAWHEYYQALPDDEKHEVWDEFYSVHERNRTPRAFEPPKLAQAETPAPAPIEKTTPPPPAKKPGKQETVLKTLASGTEQLLAKTSQSRSSAAAIKQELLTRVNKRGRPKVNHHVRALFFGLGMGSLTVLILLFSFFNERFITPFIRPNTTVSATPIIVNPDTNAPVSPEPKIIIPKIGVEAPVVYDEPSEEEKPIQKALERGVVHYGTTPNPGERGNAVIFGHSSGNILNKGDFKFAFLLLKSLDPGDTFILHYNSKQYVYKVYLKYITPPTDLSVLKARDKPSTVTLFTCDPPGLSTNRLIIVAEQIFPSPDANAASTVTPTAQPQPKQLPANSPSLWQRVKNWF